MSMMRLAMLSALFLAGCQSYWSQRDDIPDGWQPMHTVILPVDQPCAAHGTFDGCTVIHRDSTGAGYVVVYVKKGLSLDRLRCVRAHEFEHEMGRIHQIPDPMGGTNCGDKGA